METAIVIGGSMAGLLAARVLADHFDTVTIVERDRFPTEPEFRAGVPQSRHAHVLLERGRQIIEKLFPRISDEMVAGGARLYDAARDFSFLSWAGEAVRFESGIPFLAVSRTFLEHHVRRRVLALPNVRVRAETRLVGFEGTATRLTGVQTLDNEVLTANLIVDASGRDSKTPEWLETLGVAPMKVTVVKPFIGYASRQYQAPEHAVWDRVAVIAGSMPPVFTRATAIVPIEGGRFFVTMVGLNGDYPPTDDEGFVAFGRSVPMPGLHDWLAAARPVGDIYGFRFEQNRLRHFEDCVLPAGYLAVGDAVASFNPIYGQGMTVAAIGAETLSSVLASKPSTVHLPRKFHARLAKALKEPWTATTTEDLRFPGTDGKRTFAHRVAYSYIDRLFVLASRHADVRRSLLEVFGMTKRSSHLFRLPLALRAMMTSIPRGVVRPQDAPRLPSTTE
jgi:2-polyprenyl-6-methoxyphenol hydroxylase-like FAD-dependent oxidoreductase